MRKSAHRISHITGAHQRRDGHAIAHQSVCSTTPRSSTPKGVLQHTALAHQRPIVSANSVQLSNRRDSERTLEHSTRAGRLCPGLGCREPTNHAHDDFTSRAIAILMAKARHSSSARACCFTACCSLALAAFQLAERQSFPKKQASNFRGSRY